MKTKFSRVQIITACVVMFNTSLIFTGFNGILLALFILLNLGFFIYTVWLFVRSNRVLVFRRSVFFLDAKHDTDYYSDLPTINRMIYSIKPLELEHWVSIKEKGKDD